MKKTLLNFLIILCTPALLYGQKTEKNVDEHEGVWFAYLTQARLTEQFSLWNDFHARRTENFIDRWSTYIIRTGLTYHLPYNINITAGYAYNLAYPNAQYTGFARPEHRPWQQVAWGNKYKKLQVGQWYRLEERFNRKVNENTNGEPTLGDGYAFNFRIRAMITLMVPLKGDYIEPNVPFFVLNNELHVNAGKEIKINYFDQNRFFVGLGYQFTPGLSAQLGYMNQFVQSANVAGKYTENHVIRLFVFHNFDWRKKEG